MARWDTGPTHTHTILLKVYVGMLLCVVWCKTCTLILKGWHFWYFCDWFVEVTVLQVIHSTLTVQTTNIGWFPFITTLRTVTLEAVISCCISSHEPFCSILNPLSQITSKNSLPWHTAGHHTPSVISNPNCFLLSGSIPYHSNTTQTSPIDAARSLV